MRYTDKALSFSPLEMAPNRMCFGTAVLFFAFRVVEQYLFGSLFAPASEMKCATGWYASVFCVGECSEERRCFWKNTKRM